MKKLYLLILLQGLFATSLWANDLEKKKEALPEKNKKEEEKEFDIKFSGHILLDAFWDSRENLDVWRGRDLAYPLDKRCDPNNKDINCNRQFNMAPYAQMKMVATGPEIWDAKTSAILQIDNGGKYPYYGSFRLQHGYLKLDWEKTTFMAGRNYHPLTLLDYYADTIAVNAAEMFDPFNYSAQLRLIHKVDPYQVTAAIDQLYEYPQARRSASPGLFLEVDWRQKENTIGVGGHFCTMRPRLETDMNLADAIIKPVTADQHGYKETEVVKSLVAFALVQLKTEKVRWVSRLTYAENGDFYDLLGGYAVCKRNEQTDCRTYTRLRSFNFWSDLSFTKNKKEVGLVFGYAKNIGSRYKIQQDSSGDYMILTDYHATNIDSIVRIQPRMRFFKGPITLGFEIDYTRVYYGTTQESGKVSERYPISNIRLLGSIKYAWS